LGTVVRQFTRESGRTGLAQGKHRINYGAAVRENMSRLERAAADYNAGLMSTQDYVTLWRMQMETAMGATATGINSLAEGMNVIWGLTDKQLGIMKFMAGNVQVVRALIGIYRARSSWRNARAKELTAMAAAETAGYVAAQQYHRPILATAAVAFAAAAGYGTGRVVREHVDLNTSWGRREAARGIASG